MNLMKSLSELFIPFVLLSGCSVRQAYFFSPFNGTASSYHTTPMQVDSVKDATYGSLLLGIGGANDRLIDEVSVFQSSIYRSHARENCQFFYGTDLSLGNYSVSKYDTSLYSFSSSGSIGNPVNAKLINENAGNKFFGAVGLNAGVNYTIQFRQRHEWRIGTESSYKYEFGDYIRFRNKIPDSAVTGIHHTKHYVTLALYSELAFKFKSGSIGFKISIGTPLGKSYRSLKASAGYNPGEFEFPYISPAFQYTNKRWTCFVQLNAASKAFHSQFGTSYRLGAKMKEKP